MANVLLPKGIWAGDRIGNCSWMAQLHFPRIYIYSDQCACFEINIKLMYGTIYPLVMDKVSQDDLKGFLEEYELQGLLFTWKEGRNRYGYFPGQAEGRLMPPSTRFHRYKRATPEPPKDPLLEYCRKFQILNDSIVGSINLNDTSMILPEHNQDASLIPHTKNKIENKNKNINTGLKSPDSVDNLGIEDDLVVEKIDDLREKLGKTYWKDDVHKWTLLQIKLKTKPRAILFTLMAIDKKRPHNPWGYADTVLQDYNDGKYYQKNNIFADIVEKLKLL